MSIPDDYVIQRELLSLLASSPDGRLHIRNVCDELAKLHPELTDQEKHQKYVNSRSKWANRVQFARLHLVNGRMIYSDGEGPNPTRGVWIITEKGQIKAKNVEVGVSVDQVKIQEMVANELSSKELEEELFEGSRTERLSAFFERNPRLRTAAILHHGQTCKVCNFNFKANYGDHGDGYIEVHHLVPVSTLSVETRVDPTTEMTVLCSNCHRMIHRKLNLPHSLEQLRQLIGQQK